MPLQARIQRNTPKVPERPREGMSRAHYLWVGRLPCVVCGKFVDVDAHHLQRGLDPKERGTSRRAADRWCIPLCRKHHREAEAGGDDEAWLITKNIPGRDVASELWARRKSFDDMHDYVCKVLRERRRIYVE